MAKASNNLQHFLWSPICFCLQVDETQTKSRSVISVHSRSPLKPDKLTVLEIKAGHSDKVDSVLLFASHGRAKMMYETHTVQTGSYKFAWLVDWWEVGY